MGRLNEKISRFKEQNYEELRKHHQEVGTLFSDPTFPAVDMIIGTSSIPPNIEWKRPKEITKAPRLFVDIETSRIVRPGELSCNWIVSACAILAGVNEIRNKVIPDYWEQEYGEKYCGLFHFRFWQFGKWYDVVVDDHLPTINNTLLTTQAGAENEFWTALLEKAYAKLHGSYESMREGEVCDALVDFTGGVSEVIDLRAEQYADLEEKRAGLYDILHKEYTEHSIIVFTLTAPMPVDVGTRSELGICKGHAYHVTDVKKVYLGETSLRTLFKGREKVAMLRLRDPREEGRRPGSPDSAISGEGNPFAYSTSVLTRLRSRNSDWQQVKESERQRLGLLFRDETEFWMPLEDVVEEFSELTICRLVTENMFAIPGRKWKGVSLQGKWETGPKDSALDRSGGGDIDSDTFLKNPQYAFDVKSDSELMIQLLQFTSMDGYTTPISKIYFLIGFIIIQVEANRKTRLHKLWDHTPVIVREEHRRKREINYRGHLNNGRYLLIPTTYKTGDTSNFLLRIFSKGEQVNLSELKEDIPKPMMPCSCITPEIEWITVVTINSAENLVGSQTWGSSCVNVFCIVTCEGHKVKTEIAKDDTQPTWNSSYVFFRKKTNKPINFQVLKHNALLPNELIGECEVPGGVTHAPTPLSVSLIPRSKNVVTEDGETPSVGTLHLTILTEDNLMAV